MKEKLKDLLSYIIIVVVVILVRIFIATPVIVDGNSMIPNLENNQVLILYKLKKEYKRFNIIVIETEVKGKEERLVKRVIGLPGEKIKYENSKLYVNDKEVLEPFINVSTEDFNIASLGELEVPEGHYFVVGDNRGDSLDSRIIGFIPEEKIKGRVVFSLFPFDRFGSLKNTGF